MNKQRRLVLVLFLCLVILGACRGQPTPTVPATTAPTATASPTAIPPTATATAVPNTPVPPTATAEPTATATVVSGIGATPPPATEAPAPPGALDPFSLDWDDRSLFFAGLIAGEQEILDDLLEATVYHIDISIAADLASLSGRQALRYTNQADEPLDEIYLRLFPNLAGGSSAARDVAVDGQPVTPAVEQAGSALRIPLSPALPPGATTIIDLQFDVTIPTQEGGNYGEFIYLDDVLALAHFYPLVAVYDERGWNVEIPASSGDVVYAESSFYVVRVEAPESLALVASGIAVDQEVRSGRQSVTFAAGPARDFYLAGSSRYVAVSGQWGETVVNSYAFPEYAATAELVLDWAISALELFDSLIGPYPYTELDIIATPTRALGIEYPGLVVNTVRVYDLAANPDLRVVLESTTVHEVAHQWFYAVIGNDQLDEPWLDEAMAQYATYRYFLDQYGQAGAEGFYDSLVSRWERVELEEIPIGLPVSDYSELAYGAIVYGRGPIFVSTLAETMGEDLFDQFLQMYYDEHQWGIATTDSFRELAEFVCECDLADLFFDWVYP